MKDLYIIITPPEPEIFIEITHSDIKKGYQVGNYGTIKTKKGKVMKPFTDKDGYLRLELVTNKGPKKFFVHRLVALSFIEGDTNLLVNHKNSIRCDNRVDNLEWVTSKENTVHGIKYGFFKTDFTSVERGYNKYSEEFIRKICKLLSERKSTKEILNTIDYDDHKRRNIKTLIVDLRNRKTWKWITDDYSW